LENTGGKMKVRSLVVLVVCLLLSLSAVASDSKAEVFGGYQYTRMEGVNLNGFDGALAANLKDHIGVTADFSGAYKNQNGASLKSYTYTFGPVISGRKDAPFVPFAHALFGGFHSTIDVLGVSSSGNGFAMQIGGGVDVRMSDKLAIRAGQFDWMSLRSNGSASNNNFRYSAGVVLHF
jgi:Outer membrane protein beta-barrel domain